MKKFTKALILMLAALMLFASCAPEPEKTPEKEDPPKPVAPQEIKVPKYADKDFLGIDDLPAYAHPVRLVEVDPAEPYNALHRGLFDNQMCSSTSVPRDGKDLPVGTNTRYSIFIPEKAQPKVPVMMILTPNGTTAAAFARSEIGRAWMEEANKTGAFCVAFIEPFHFENQLKWNLTLSTDDITFTKTSMFGKKEYTYTPRDERAAILDVFTSIRKKAISDNAYVNCDKNGMSLIGYGEGASMAAVLAASWPTMFPNTICVEPKDLPAELIADLLAAPTYPHNSEYKDGSSNYGTITAGQIPMPMYVVKDPAHAEDADKIVELWKGVNEKALKEDGSSDESFYVSKLVEEKTPEVLSGLALANGRFRGYRGGTLRASSHMLTNTTDFKVYEEVIPTFEGDTRIRRWAVHAPETRVATAEDDLVPLVVVVHGSTAAISDICDESKWADVSDRNGFVVAYVQAYPDKSNGYHSPEWDRNSLDNKYIDTVVTKVSEEYKIDPSRIFITGHSAGGFQIMNIISKTDYATRFAGFAPIGGFFPPGKSFGPPMTKPETLIPIWMQAGEWEYEGMDNRFSFDFDTMTMTPNPPEEWTAISWAKFFDPTAVLDEADHDFTGYPKDKYLTKTYKAGEKSIPVFNTQVMDCPHVYMAEQAEMIWDNFFSKLSRDPATKNITYDGQVFKYTAPAKPAAPAGK